MYQLTIEQSFDAAHFLADYHGKCSNIHGHRWRVLLEVESEALQEDRQERGMCVDFSVIKKRRLRKNKTHSLLSLFTY